MRDDKGRGISIMLWAMAKRIKNKWRDRKAADGEVVGRLPPSSAHIPAHVMAERRREKFKKKCLTFAPRCTSKLQIIRQAQIGNATYYRMEREDPAFKKAIEAAMETGKDVIREEIRSRAIDGWLEPVVSAGKLVTYQRKKSDGLLTMLAKAHLNEYRTDVPQYSAAGLVGAADRLRAKLATVLERRRTRVVPGKPE